jgi:hypothetical protein
MFVCYSVAPSEDAPDFRQITHTDFSVPHNRVLSIVVVVIQRFYPESETSLRENDVRGVKDCG